MAFRVIIIGGSVSGLSLACMLERFGIDYILLEAHAEIAPQVGASIGLVSNGLHILDPLGCYERLKGVVGNYCYVTSEIRDLKGNVMFRTSGAGVAETLEQETGYPLLFLDRQMLMQVLYDTVQHTDRILTRKRLAEVELMGDVGVRVHTQDGSIYEGDIVVGADGVHSTTRGEMWRLANKLAPGTFGSDNMLSCLEADNKCLLGISSIPPTFPPENQQIVTSPGVIYMATPRPEGRLYWFLSLSMPTATGPDIPRWTKEDERVLAEEHSRDRITDGVNFSDIYENRWATALVSLEKHVFARWHFGRIITIGDAAHKVGFLWDPSIASLPATSSRPPTTTLGGNGAIETAALLCNALVRRLCLNSPILTTREVCDTFEEIEAHQLRRAQGILKYGKRMQPWVYQRYLLSGLVMKAFLPWMGAGFLAEPSLKAYASAPVIEGIDVPVREGTRGLVRSRERAVEKSRPGPGSGWLQRAWIAGAFSSVALYLPGGRTFSFAV